MNLRLVSIAILLIPAAAFSTPPKNLNQEYEQVRAIALRDPKVKAAFEKASQRLEEKIVEIDPALRNFVKGQPLTTTRINLESSAKQKVSAQPAKPAMHIIMAGDMLSSVATKYKVSVAGLKDANPGVEERKLRVGEKLIIPTTDHQ